MASSEPAAGSLAVVSGWGIRSYDDLTLPTQLQAVEVDIISRATCKSAYAAFSEITENVICAAVFGGGKDFCSGDEGGPLVVGGKLVGIASWPWGCGSSIYPGVYTNVATIKDFITQETGVQ